MKQKRLTRNEIIANKEKLIIENFNRVSRQLGMVSEAENLVKYAIYAAPFSYPNSKLGYFNKKLYSFIDNHDVRKYPKEDFVCNIDDVKIAREVARKNDFNVKGITWEPFYKFEDRFYRDIEKETTTEEIVASDGGYYGGEKTQRVISQYELDMFKKHANEILDVFLNNKHDGVYMSNLNNGYVKTIMQGLKYDYGFPIEWDSEEGATFYVLDGEINPEDLKLAVDTIVHNVYDKVDKPSYEDYLDAVVSELRSLDSGEKLVSDVIGGRTNAAYIKRNYEKGISPEKTASYLRDSWFGV